MLAPPEETPAEAPGWVALHAAVTGRNPSRRSDGAGSAEGARVPLPQPQPVCVFPSACDPDGGLRAEAKALRAGPSGDKPGVRAGGSPGSQRKV